MSKAGTLKQVAQTLHSCALPTRWGTFVLSGLRAEPGREDVILTIGNVSDGAPVLVRVHSECLTGDVFGSRRCDCGEQLDLAMASLAREGRGALVYLRQEGRGIGLINKIRAYRLQEQGADTLEANRMLGFADDARTYDRAAVLLRAAGIARIRLMTNNPAKISALIAEGIEVTERVPLAVAPTSDSRSYLQTKRNRMGHLF